jgi:hypothetical protein
MSKGCAATVDKLVRLHAKVGASDPYSRLADVWRRRASGCLDDMLAGGETLARDQVESDSTVARHPVPSATELFKAEYSTLEVIEEYLKSADGSYLRPPSGNREGFYAAVLSAGKTLLRDAIVLDVGCGIGRTVLDYSLRCLDGLVVGLDHVMNFDNQDR